MADSTGIDKGLRELTQADFDGPAKIGNAISDLAKSRMPDAEREMEHRIGVARAAKDGDIAAIVEARGVGASGLRKSWPQIRE